MNSFTFQEYANIHFMYGDAEGNSRSASRLYTECYPHILPPCYQVFSVVYTNLRENVMLRYELMLEDPDKVYFSGDDIKGHVSINLDSNITVQGITIRLVGEACVVLPSNVKPTRPVDRRKRFSNKIPSPAVHGEQKTICKNKNFRFSAVERYFHHREYLFGHKYSSFKEQLWKGSHSFSFQYTLPAQLPSSFVGRFGFVRYYCESTLERWRNKQTKRIYFSVSNITDINQVPKADCSFTDEKCTNSCFFCVPRGTIIASSEMRQRGFACGESVNISLDIHNMSNSDVTSTTVNVVQIAAYCSSGNTRPLVDERVMLAAPLRAVPQGESEHSVVSLTLPPLPPSTLGHDICKLIHIHYRVDMILDITNSKDQLVLQLPLIVGNIPLRRNFANLENDSVLNVKKQFIIPFKHYKQRGLPQVWSEPSSQVLEPNDECVQVADFSPSYPFYKEKSKSKKNCL